MINKVSFYGYLFQEPPDKIIRYDILWKADDKFLLKHTLLDSDFKNPSDKMVVMVYDSLFACLSGIIGKFRNLEVEHGIYKHLKPVIELGDAYEPLIHELHDSIMKEQVKSFSVFGHLKKYKPQAAANKILLSMGYFVLTTKRPHVYVLDDFIMQEYRAVAGEAFRHPR
jgi:hypothetical protein